MKKLIFFVVILVISFLMTAASMPGKSIGPEVSQHNGRELKWEEGSRDYFTLFRTMLSRSAGGNSNESDGNPQADGCLMSSGKMIFPGNLPDDAVVTDAFIVWTTAHTPDQPSVTTNQQYNNPTDNIITLNFDGDAGANLTKEVAASQSYTMGTSTGFEFESSIYEMELNRYRMGVYTYRVEITDFFNEILSSGRESGLVQDGKAYEGNYTVEGLSCYNGNPFINTTMMVSNWAIFFVYTSSKIKPKKIYVYNGLTYYRDTQSTLFVSGFELPDDPSVRVSLLSSEGDPGLYNDLYESEGLLFRANESQQYVSLSNSCNPLMSGYTEVYNSVSSYYQWDAANDAQPFCIGGLNGTSAEPDIPLMEWGVDFDAFLINEQTFPGYLSLGDKDFEFNISANQDTIFSNLMIVSVDTKSPKFDIPESASSNVVPYGREKHSCSCATEEDYTCFDERPFFYFIRVQNWGENKASNVTVKDTLPLQVTYVPGTTEMATKFDESGNGINWTYIQDGEGDKFPLEEPFEVAGEMNPCDKVNNTCPETVLIRFLVKPIKNLPKHEVISNSAEISDASGGVYKSNSEVAYRVRLSQNCPVITECSTPERADCGGDKSDGGDTEEDENLGTDTVVSFEQGKNSPESDEAIIVVSPVNDLVVGQIAIKGVNEKDDGKNFKISSLIVKVTVDDPGVSISNLKLINDIDGDGILGESETVIATSSVKEGYSTFLVDIGKQLFAVNTLHHLIIIADAQYNSEDISVDASFNIELENNTALSVKDEGNPEVKGEKIEFQEFMLEPTTGYFIVTKGVNDPAVPSPDKINANNSILQLRLKSVDGDNEVNSITIKTTGTTYAEFGKGITSLSIYYDADSDGEVHTSEGDVKISEVKEILTSRTYTFENLGIKFKEGEEKHLIINATLNLNAGEKARITIPTAGVKLNSDQSVYKLPISSKEFINECDPMDENCATADSEESGCSAIFID